MTVAFELPAEVEEALRSDGSDANTAAREAVLVELFRRGRLTHFQLSQGMGLGRYETDGVLKRHGVVEDLITFKGFCLETLSMSSKS